MSWKHATRVSSDLCRDGLYVTFIPRAPQKPSQSDNAAKAQDLKRRARDIARDSHGMEDQIRAMVSSYMAPEEDDEDPELMIGRLVCWWWLDTYRMSQVMWLLSGCCDWTPGVLSMTPSLIWHVLSAPHGCMCLEAVLISLSVFHLVYGTDKPLWLWWMFTIGR